MRNTSYLFLLDGLVVIFSIAEYSGFRQFFFAWIIVCIFYVCSRLYLEIFFDGPAQISQLTDQPKTKHCSHLCPLICWQLSAANCAVHCATAVPSPMAIALPSCCSLCCHCPLLLLPSIMIMPPPYIVIAAAVNLASPPNAPLLHWWQLYAHCAAHQAAAVPLLILIALTSHRPLRRRCPSPLPPSIAIMPPPSIVIAAAIHLALPPIALLLHWQRSSAAHCAAHCVAAILLPITIALLSCRPLCCHCPLPLPPSSVILPPPAILHHLLLHRFCISSDCPLPIVPSIMPPPSHCPLQSLLYPATHCAAMLSFKRSEVN
jgi:hypothetical protein